MNTEGHATKKVTVVGLGQMGSTLAKLLLQSGYNVTVWNRTQTKAEALIQAGAHYEANVSSAIKRSDVIVVCVSDYATTHTILAGTDKEVFLGKIFIQLTTGSPQEATTSSTYFTERHAQYLDGAIQVAPDQMAKPDTTIFISGNSSAFNLVKELLSVFGGNIKYLGEKVSAASAMDLASLSYLYGALLGFFHAVQIADVEGFNIELLGEVVKDVSPGYAEFMAYESKVIQSKNFEITQSPLAISVDATERIHQASLSYGINTELSQLMASFLKRANDAGLARQELASIVKVFNAHRN
ncbi:NAD(P)-dependent oxidoreductase [Pseudochryseolinea flava]|uniref:NAD(P)-dependent oxidoreductase n=1 Tax=Pseudochryseolinea flava TaxID=2059302 RepID=A0A364Y7H8_9BACT|nr:NAD(P)-binding domain-containing protein [Pseudochryseolinea flava]RAW02900.1 NAD(P)-dependent oxidoreductase [Pseudochryseolinea flava]